LFSESNSTSRKSFLFVPFAATAFLSSAATIFSFISADNVPDDVALNIFVFVMM